MTGSNICPETGTKIAGAQLKHYWNSKSLQSGLRGDTLTRLIVWCIYLHCLFRNYECMSLNFFSLANSADTDDMLHSAVYKRLIESQIGFNSCIPTVYTVLVQFVQTVKVKWYWFSCVDPESFVRGGLTLTMFFF